MGSCTQHRNDPEEALRRIDRLEACRRRVTRSVSRCTPDSALAEDLKRQREELDAQLVHWRGVVAKAEARGFKVWSRDDFARGDYVRYLDTWYEVLKVNRRSLTVPARSPGRTWTLRYHDGIAGRMSAEEMAERERGGASGAHESESAT